MDANPKYAHIKYQDGRETTVSLRDLAPQGLESHMSGDVLDQAEAEEEEEAVMEFERDQLDTSGSYQETGPVLVEPGDQERPTQGEPPVLKMSSRNSMDQDRPSQVEPSVLRRSSRETRGIPAARLNL